jgi:hypothetical protein
MHIVYRARHLADAHSACDRLAKLGIDSHIAHQTQHQDAEVICVLVDNRTFDKARRALREWAPGRDHGHTIERSVT